ncbi:M20/M25/M40 family metallo-hydrolase [Methylomicrobium sp. Wu6]|uniref:M20/M25/M40 family metallo-hydrolase n=1 Tax=Methylomicrobium sp. Wu6 TaxID=3107928 RepID=UPI002DD66FCA|nr:M20/M25/M40 family metallo-hydrolase [Methylomicrobium sp. Wu6]MEC4748420.1 M20/M25/M40 family metallo-hydrolase [Methylomicrobium sp. Wu6]
MTKRPPWQHASIIILFWGLAFWACSRMIVPPAVDRDQSVTASYSFENALLHLRHIAVTPHPVGSRSHDAVAAYLLEQIKALGYHAEVQETIASALFDTEKPFVKAAPIKNIMVRVAGKESQGAALIAAHYDSVETSPGAADDGAAVASMLEVLRILKQGARPKNDMIFLFSDAEELGLLGSRAFIERHPWARDCVLALNFEARGNGGVLLMFETSAHNGRLVEHYARAAVQPVASSLMFSIYRKLLHNDTDFSIFREAGIAGMNFAFIEGWTDYHTALDNLERLDPRTLALQGHNMLQLARHFADADLKNFGQDGDFGYFNLPFGKLFVFSLDDHLPLLLAGAALLSFVLLAMIGGYYRRIGMLQFFQQTGIFLLHVGLITGINFVFHAALLHIYDNNRWLPEPYNAILYFQASCCITFALFMLLHASLSRSIKPQEFTAAALCLWLLAGIYLALAFPGGVFFAVVPGLAMLAAWTFSLFRPGTPSTFITGVCSGAVLFIVAPTLYLAHHALGFHFDWLLMIVGALTLGLVTPALEILRRAYGRMLPAIFLALASILLVRADLSSDFSRVHPKPNSIIYAWDGTRNSAQWLSYDPEPDNWTRQFLTAKPGISTAGIFDDFIPSRRMLVLETQPVPLAIPSVRVVEQRIAKGKKYLAIHIRSRRDAPLIRLKADNMAAAIQIYAGNQLIHQNLPAASPLEYIEFHGLPSEGVTFTFVLPADIPMKMLQLIEIRPDLTEVWQKNFKSRPENTIPMRSSSSMPVDAVILRQSYPL